MRNDEEEKVSHMLCLLFLSAICLSCFRESQPRGNIACLAKSCGHEYHYPTHVYTSNLYTKSDKSPLCTSYPSGTILQQLKMKCRRGMPQYGLVLAAVAVLLTAQSSALLTSKGFPDTDSLVSFLSNLNLSEEEMRGKWEGAGGANMPENKTGSSIRTSSFLKPSFLLMLRSLLPGNVTGAPLVKEKKISKNVIRNHVGWVFALWEIASKTSHSTMAQTVSKKMAKKVFAKKLVAKNPRQQRQRQRQL